MIDGQPRRWFLGAALFAGCFLLLLFMRLLPLPSGPRDWPGADLGLCLTLAWVIRRPEQVPALLIALLFLAEDIALYRPIALWAAIVLLGTETVRARDSRWREQPFLIEWLRVAMLIGMMMLAYRFTLAALFLPISALGQVILQYLATVAGYPLVVLVARWVIGLRRPVHGGAETRGFGR